MGMKKVLMGNHSVSYGAMLSRVQVIAAYPITPQTQVVEELSEICASKRLDAKFIKVESEHSAMACCIGASAAGARAFTATSSQGLLLMHELLHWAAIGRHPIVMANVNRAVAPGWSIWTDQNDSLAQRDTGWIQWYCETNQEVLDSVIIGYKVAEKVMLPVMITYDAFILSHTYEPVDIPDIEFVDEYLSPFKPKFSLDCDDPRAFGALTSPDHVMELRYIMQEDMMNSFKAMDTAELEFEEKFGRKYGTVETFMTDDAEIILVAASSMVSTCRAAVEKMRAQGEKVGLLKLRCFRPFPKDAIKRTLSKAKKIAILDRNVCFGSGGIFNSEIRSAFTGVSKAPKIYSYIMGLGGRDIMPEAVEEAYYETKKRAKPADEPVWIGVKSEEHRKHIK
jgi:pyruvate/2-oxoacid:ferredoxin oxidoreductase alpha subunit